MSFKFIVYSTPTCPYCDMAKNLIAEQGMSYAEASLDTQEAVDEFKKTTGHKTVPQIYLATEEQEYIGGYDDLEKFILEMVNLLQTFQKKNEFLYLIVPFQKMS